MPPRRWIDKKNAATYQLFHRPQDDPLINDPEAQDRILHQVRGPQPTTEQASAQHKTGKTLEQLQREFANERVRKNEGEAANFGIYYDDTEYDYMQHLKELGGDGTGHYVEARTAKEKSKSMKLEDMLAQTSLDDNRSDMLSTASTYSRKPTYQDMQNIPDAIAGFQPDMDPRLREALEALEDDAFVEEDGEGDLFDQLVADGEEVDPDEFRDTYIEDDDDGWESDATEKAPVQPRTSDAATKEKEPFRIDNDGGNAPTEMPREDEAIPDTNPEDNDWMREFAKFKKDAKATNKPAAPSRVADVASTSKFTAPTMFTANGTPIRRKKRKGAMTNPSAYSMSSSALTRTEGLRLLDDRFERVEALYALDEEGEEEEYDGDDMSMVSGMTGMTGASKASEFSEAPSLVDANGVHVAQNDFNSIMDGFLDNWSDRAPQAKRKGAKGKRGKNGNEEIGMRMLDEIRSGLGPARVPNRRK